MLSRLYQGSSPYRTAEVSPSQHDDNMTDRMKPRTCNSSPYSYSCIDEETSYRMSIPTSFDTQSSGYVPPSYRTDRPQRVPRASSSSPLRRPITDTISFDQLILSAMCHLPVPVIVLDGFKTVIFANAAFGNLLGIDSPCRDDAFGSAQVRLRGQTLSQVGIDMLQDGRLAWVSWESLLDSVANGARIGSAKRQRVSPNPLHSGGSTKPHPSSANMSPWHSKVHHITEDVSVDVVISGKDIGGIAGQEASTCDQQIHANMIITAWELGDQQTYFTLTFTKNSFANTSSDISNPGMEIGVRGQASRALGSQTQDPVLLSPTPFPPPGPPSKRPMSGALSILQKLTKMKDVLLDNTEVPIFSMWKDGSAIYPNKAARKLWRKDGRFDSKLAGLASQQNWVLWDWDFSRKLSIDEYPISILAKTEKPFSGLRVGAYEESGRQVVYDALGETIRDDVTGEVFAVVATLRDVTRFTQEISEIKEHDEERFRLICDTMPQLVWTTAPDGMFDFFNIRWYHYTGFTASTSFGEGWQNALHPDDLAQVLKRWAHSLESGEPFGTQYRIRSKYGEWRWFLGRAMPLRNKNDGAINRWFGTCTDIHEGMEATLAAKRTRQQLLTVIAHSRVTLFTVDVDRRVTMLEGALIWNARGENCLESEGHSHWFIGQNVYEVFNRLAPDLSAGERPKFLHPIESILDGRVAEGIQEHDLLDRSYRTRFLPLWRKSGSDAETVFIEGVIGVIMDVTELKERETALEEEAREKRQAIANEMAAKEANRLKSQFLANMSHEIRTPITGVLGMTEVLAATIVDHEQREYLGNIQRSASALLTVVNDILDFSKVESGRLDIEEVQFSLSAMIEDVHNMFKLGATRKNLSFQYDALNELKNELVVIGDPGRVRQIIMNLLTNSVKFTSEGYVRFSVCKEQEAEHTITMKFTVEDSGIGMTDEVKRKLFQPFSQGDASTARKFGGTGLGLMICKNLLELMHGRIDLKSIPGRGTVATFWIPFRKPSACDHGLAATTDSFSDRLQWEMSLICDIPDHGEMFKPPMVGRKSRDQVLPLSEQADQTAGDHSVMIPSIKDDELSMSERAKVHVLVVEDNAINQRIATKFVTMLGFRVAAVWNGREALEYLRKAKDGKNSKPDIILMDVQMPIVDGYKCTYALRHHAPFKSYVKNIPIVAMTASAIQGDREKCTRAGMDDYLSKPVRSITLERMLVKWSLRKGQIPAVSENSEWECPIVPESTRSIGREVLSQLAVELEGDVAKEGAMEGCEDAGCGVTIPSFTWSRSQTTPKPLTILQGGSTSTQSPTDVAMAGDSVSSISKQ